MRDSSLRPGALSSQLCEGQGTQRRPLPLAHPHPGSKSGTFYFAEKRNFLLCLDSVETFTNVRCFVGRWSSSGISSGAPIRASKHVVRVTQHVDFVGPDTFIACMIRFRAE